ncbi:MAG: 50S ribosomal protein L25 [Spirochaeta sp.]|jgi:large subunit ribosomal protein L25|nr:50S ribosomal protein L25 [Spirochaeta sp.]
MEQKVLNGITRTTSGKGQARALRRSGRIPAVVYGHSEPISFSVEAREFHKEFHTVSESQLITLKLEKDDRTVLIKDYSEDITNGAILHIDFFEVEAGKKLHTRIAVELEGSPVGVREGGVLEHTLYEVDIECFPKDIPEHLVVDVSGLSQGDSIHISDIPVPKGVVILNNEDQTVASVTTPRAAVEDEEGEEEAAAGEVPVIGEEEEATEEE